MFFNLGEISELKMKQISQSQFISISETLCEIVKGLNESQIAATFESVVSRLCSSFDSVVIPPIAAIKKSLDLLIGEQRLDSINGSYHFKNPVMVAKPRKKLTPTPLTVATEKQGPNRHVLLSKEATTDNQRHTKREKINGYECLESETVKQKTKNEKLHNTGNCDSDRHREHKMREHKKDMSFERKDRRKYEKNKVVKSSSLKVRKPNHCIPRRQFSYEELRSNARHELEDKKQVKKRNSFLGRLSRLFRIEDDKLTSNDEMDNHSDGEICHDGWENVVTDEQAQLLSMETQQKRAATQNKVEKNRRKKSNRIKERQIYKTGHIGNLSRSKNVQIRRPVHNKRCASLSSRSSTNVSSRLRTSDGVNTKFGCNNKRTEQKTQCSPKREQKGSAEQYSSSSYSGTSCSNLNYSDSSLSSESSVELARKSFHYSEEDTTDVESLQAARDDGASEFCSTQAICGDLELSTLSLNPSNKMTSSSDTSSIKHVEKHPVTSGMTNSGVLDHQTNLRSRNHVQLIGVL